MRHIRSITIIALALGAAVAAAACTNSSDWTRVRAQEPAVLASASAAGAGAPVLVNCEPHQRALVRQKVVNGETVAQVDCVSGAAAPVYTDIYGRPLSSPYGMTTPSPYGMTPAVYTAPQVVPATVAYSVPETRVVRTRQVIEPERRVVRRSGRTWKKSALVIGGSTAAGAGIGGLIGGKKGALVGAAIGGGASTIFESTKHR